MKIAIINDTHCGVRNSSELFIQYQGEFYSKIFFPYLKEHNIKTIFHLGDYFDHRQRIPYKTLHANRKHFLEPLVENGINMTIINGNHDLVYRNSNEISSLKELLGYFTENVQILMDPIEISYGKNMKTLWIPWINAENQKQCYDAIKKSNADIVLGHFEFGGFPMQKGIPAHGNSDLSSFSKFKKVLSGHYHTKSSKKNIHYLGAQMEFSWADVDDPKYFHILDTDTLELTPIRNPITIYKKVRYTSKTKFTKKSDYENKFVRVIIEEKDNQYEFDRFIEQIELSGSHDLKIIDASQYVEINASGSSNMMLEKDELKNAEQDTKTFIQHYIKTEVETSLEKEQLNKMMCSIFDEAEQLGMY
jgi:DNA repair exonuclease SbcCD nuclease subunit